jgi:hypothetical protein
VVLDTELYHKNHMSSPLTFTLFFR